MADFSEMTVGYSITGAEEYVQNLNAQMITGTKSIVRDKLLDVKTALEAGWVGNSEINFMNRLSQSADELCQSLDAMEEAIHDMMSAIEEEMSNRDKNIVEETF